VKGVVGPQPPPAGFRRPRRGLGRSRIFGRARRRLAPRPSAGPKVSARAFALLAFAAWGATLALLDWSFGAFREPNSTALVEPIGEPEAPPPAILPEETAQEEPATDRAAEPARRPSWWPFGRGSADDSRDDAEAARAEAEAAEGEGPEAPRATGEPLAAVPGLEGLLVPVTGISAGDLRDQFGDPRSGGRRHEAIDILAPRNTPIVAAFDGHVRKLFDSKAGGLSIYQFDPAERYALYYAHLESYAPGLDEGDRIRKGQVIGYVGTSGNAPRDVPHLHFAIFRLGPEKRWHEGEPLNPYPLLARR
jgi:murein DD-endopeptidase MepM/ murein hydrolase activator NlpD